MSKFKVGDRVRVIGNDSNFGTYPLHGFEIGSFATVVSAGRDTIGCEDDRGRHQILYNRHAELAGSSNKIVVTTDGKTTTAKLFDGKNLVKSAKAKCSPADEFVFETGAALALDRLLGLGELADPEPEKLFPLEDIKAGYLLKVRDDDGSEYFMTVIPNRYDSLGCCGTHKRAYWPLNRFGSELRYADSMVIAVYGRAYNDDLLKNDPAHRTLLWSRK